MLFDDKIFKKTDITDISLAKNMFMDTIRRNAIVCERNNQKKGIYYLMEVSLANLRIFKHPVFIKEEQLSSQLVLKV